MAQALIIEDDFDIAEILEEMLEALEFEVDKTFSYQEAVKFVQSYEYTVIISDLNLGAMSKKGTEVMAHVKGKPLLIFISGEPHAVEETKSHVAAGAKFFPKPFNLNDIASYIQENS